MNGKQSRKKVSNYCEKCERFICKECFEEYHSCVAINIVTLFCSRLKKALLSFQGVSMKIYLFGNVS